MTTHASGTSNTPDTSNSLTRIVLVDDDPGVRELIRTQLRKREDLAVVGDAADGREAIVRCRELQPDLVICDVTMPGMGGIDALPGLREAAPGARVLMHSCREDDLTIRRAMSAGAHGYLVKGAVRAVLTARIDDLMSQLV